MSSIEPKLDTNSIGSHTDYAVNIESSEKYNRQFPQHAGFMAYNHASVLVSKPTGPEALKILTGELAQRRGAYYDFPTDVSRIFLYDTSKSSVDTLEANIKIIENLDCSHRDPDEQKMRKQEKAILLEFCHNFKNQKQAYDDLKLRILEFLQG